MIQQIHFVVKEKQMSLNLHKMNIIIRPFRYFTSQKSNYRHSYMVLNWQILKIQIPAVGFEYVEAESWMQI